MTDPPIQVWSRYIAIDIHKHYLMIGGIDAHKRIVLQPRKLDLHRFQDWAQANLYPTDAVVIEATTNAWVIYDLLVTLVGRAVVVHPAKDLSRNNFPFWSCRPGRVVERRLA